MAQALQRPSARSPTSVDALEPRHRRRRSCPAAVAEALGRRAPDVRRRAARRDRATSGCELWRERVEQINWELFDRGTEAFTWYALEELAKAAASAALLSSGAARRGVASVSPTAAMQVAARQDVRRSGLRAVRRAARANWKSRSRDRVFFWPRQTGPKGDLVDDEMGRVLQVPGWSNIFTQPIINRIEMLSTGVRTDIGVKVFGPDLDTIDRVCKEIEAALKPLNGARDVIAAPIMGKGYLQIDIDREQAARYGISVEDIQNEIEVALAGRAVTYTVEKRDRFPGPHSLRPRRPRGRGEHPPAAGQPRRHGAARRRWPAAVRPPTRARSVGAAATLGRSAGEAHAAAPPHAGRGQAADSAERRGRRPDRRRSGDDQERERPAAELRDAQRPRPRHRRLRRRGPARRRPEGASCPKACTSNGAASSSTRCAPPGRCGSCFPAVIVLIFVILYLTYNDLADAGLMMLAVPEALAGGAFFMYLFPKIMHGWDAPPMDFSVAVWVGFIACFGMATETGIIMLVYLREAIEKRGGLENIKSLEELRQAVIEGAVHRLRPKLLTEGVAIIAIFPMVFANGVGGEILAPMALPVLGGLLISDEVVDLFLPVRFYWVRRARWLKLHGEAPAEGSRSAEMTPVAM